MIRERRLKLGLSQETAAERAGISRNEWNQMERGTRGIGPRNAARFARVLGGEPNLYLTRPTRKDLEDLERRIAELELAVAELKQQRLDELDDPPLPQTASA